MSDQYEDLTRFRKFAGSEIHRLSNSLKEISEAVLKIQVAINSLEEYSYQFNVKIIGLPHISENENADETAQLCVKLFN